MVNASYSSQDELEKSGTISTRTHRHPCYPTVKSTSLMVTRISEQTEYKIRDFDEVRDASGLNEGFIEDYQYRTLWTYAANCLLGLWLITQPFLFDYRSADLFLSDIISGVLVIAVELLSFSPRRCWVRCFTPVIAFWLLFAPLVFWSPRPAVYLSDTIIASLLITFSFLIPAPPGQGGVEKIGPDMPPYWSYNPSSWIRRWLGIALALVGFFISRYLAACQLGYIGHAYDPFFGGQSDLVLHSSVSRSFPISDAGFGSVAYMLEVLAGFMGDRARWRTSPWIVTTFALLVVPLGVTSIVLVILQPTVVGAWCGLCLIAAAALLTSVPLAVHEIIAMGQFLAGARARGKNVWKVFWKGGTVLGAGAADPDRRNFSPGQRWVASVQGVTVPWTLAIQIAIGIWLMARPDIITSGVYSADCDHLLGAIAVTAAAVATAEVTRTARFINVIAGVGLLFAAFLFAGSVASVFWSDFICGIILIITSLPRGDIIERYAGWNKVIK